MAKGKTMRALFWLILLLLAALGVASILDHTGVYDVPMIDVVKQVDATEAT